MSKFFLHLVMKNRFAAFLLLLLPFHLAAQSSDTTIRNVRISFAFSKNIFPKEWRDEPIDATASQMDRREIPRSKRIITKALNKYPVFIFKKNLRSVFFLKEMKFFNVGYGGTNSENAVYITNRGNSEGYTDKYLEQTFHHEFSSILYRNYIDLFDTLSWKEANSPDFSYNDPENGVGAIRSNQSSQTLDTFFCEKGILTQYAGSGIENDVNTFAQNLFRPEKNFWKFVDRFPRIRKKTEILINFYHRLSSIYTETYFRKLSKK
jgi:hypothetical protein